MEIKEQSFRERIQEIERINRWVYLGKETINGKVYHCFSDKSYTNLHCFSKSNIWNYRLD